MNMGVDLTFLPFWSENPTCDFSHDMLSLERRPELWDAIYELPSRDVPEKFRSYRGTNDDFDETCYGLTIRDCYDSPVKYTTAKHLLTLYNRPAVRDNHTNRAIWAYLKELPLDWKIALYWS